MTVNRRTLVKGGSTLGVLLAGGIWARFRFLPPGRSRQLLPVDELARRFAASLDDRTRGLACVAYDHPMRQYHNRGVKGGGAPIGSEIFDWEQRRLLTDLLHAGLSEQGRERVPNEFFLRFGGVQHMKVLLCGEPESPPYQLILTGPHLNLRLGGASKEGAAFGGPQVYGDQRGNGHVGLPGNLWRFQLDLARRLFETLDEGRRRVALLPTAPVQTEIQLQGKGGALPGIPVAELAPGQKALARNLVDAILSTYPPSDVAFANECLAANGGLDGLCLAYYRDGELDASGLYQIFRLEGPAAVFHFRGAPHVHAFVNVAMDGDAPLSAGEALGQNPAPLADMAVKRLFERALRLECGTDLAFYDREAVAGRLRKGTIRSGDIYALESWQDTITVVEVAGRDLARGLADVMRAAGTVINSERRYTVATTAEVASSPARNLGRVVSTLSAGLVRDAAISYLRAHGFAELHAERG
jgi:uncharacterized protein DUF3500/5'-nucleotidase-like protein